MKMINNLIKKKEKVTEKESHKKNEGFLIQSLFIINIIER